MFNKKALLTGAVMATVLGISFTSCKKNNDDPVVPTPRSKTYDLKGTAGDDKDKKLGDITLTENTDSSVNVVVNLSKNTKDADYKVYLIGGTIAAPTTDTIIKNGVKGTGAALSLKIVDKATKLSIYQPNNVRKDTAFKYNDAVALSSFLKVVNGADVFVIGSFGK